MGDENSTLSNAEARHLLRRTGFGALPRDIATFTGRGAFPAPLSRNCRSRSSRDTQLRVRRGSLGADRRR